MDRREALRISAILMGGSLSAATVAGVLNGCKASTSPDWTPSFVPKELANSLAELCETIIPAGKTPGAKDAKVERFIDVMMNDVFKAEDQDTFTKGLKQLDSDTRAKYGKAFDKIKPEERVEMVKAMDDELRARTEQPASKPFYDLVKELTVTGYCTSEPGATMHLKYVAVPGDYKPCIPLSEVGGTWAI